MNIYYREIRECIIRTIDEKKRSEKGELLGIMNQKLKSIIDDEDLKI